MESGQWTNKLDHMKVKIPSEADHQMMVSGSGSGLTRQPSVTRSNCLCSPTTHAGSFRCRLHHSPSLQRTKSMDTSGRAKANNHTISTNDNTTTTAL